MRLRFCLPFAIIAAPALADSDFARELATVLAGEKACGLKYDEIAVADLIADRVDPADLGFASTMQSYARIAEYAASELSGATKAAHCAAVTQTARHYGLIE